MDVSKLYQRWQELNRRFDETDDGAPEMQSIITEIQGVTRTMADTPAETADGILAKLRLVADEMRWEKMDGPMLASAIADVERLGQGGGLA